MKAKITAVFEYDIDPQLYIDTGEDPEDMDTVAEGVLEVDGNWSTVELLMSQREWSHAIIECHGLRKEF